MTQLVVIPSHLASRIDVVIDFSQFTTGQSLYLVENTQMPQFVSSPTPPDPATDEDPATFLKENGLTFSIKEQLPRIVTILSPMLVGPTAALFGKLLGGT